MMTEVGKKKHVYTCQKHSHGFGEIRRGVFLMRHSLKAFCKFYELHHNTNAVHQIECFLIPDLHWICACSV